MRDVELKIEEIPIAELVPYANNAKKHTRAQLDAIENSIKEFGFRAPVIVWRNEDGAPEVVAGHARTTAAKNLGMKTVPCVSCDDLTDAQRRALTLVDNQTTMMTGWDEDLLAYELDTLSSEFDMNDFGFTDEMADYCLSSVEEDTVPEVFECKAKRGEIWQLGDHVLMCGDATSEADMKRLIEAGGGSADMLLTDPPYNVSYEGKTEDALTIENDSWSSDEGFVEFLRGAFSCALGAMSPGAAFYVWYADVQSANFLEAAKRAGMTIRQLLVWAKNTFSLGRRDYQWRHETCLYGWKDGAAHYFFDSRTETTVLEFDKPSRSEEHPTMKPVELFAYLIRNSSRPGDLVLDPFAGSGTTVVACEQLKRRAAVIELDPHYCDVIIARWESLTGKKAELLSD